MENLFTSRRSVSSWICFQARLFILFLSLLFSRAFNRDPSCNSGYMTVCKDDLILPGLFTESRDRCARGALFELSVHRRTSPLEDHVTSRSTRNPIVTNVSDTFPPGGNVANKLGLRSRSRNWIIALSVIQIAPWVRSFSIKAVDKIVGLDIRTASLKRLWRGLSHSSHSSPPILYESIRRPISACLATRHDFQLSDLSHCRPTYGRHRLPRPILGAERDLQVRRGRDLRERVPLRLRRSPSENYGFRRFNLIQKFRIGGTISLPRYPRNIMS